MVSKLNYDFVFIRSSVIYHETLMEFEALFGAI